MPVTSLPNTASGLATTGFSTTLPAALMEQSASRLRVMAVLYQIYCPDL